MDIIRNNNSYILPYIIYNLLKSHTSIGRENRKMLTDTLVLTLQIILFILLKVAEFSQNFVGKSMFFYSGETNKKIEEMMMK